VEEGAVVVPAARTHVLISGAGIAGLTLACCLEAAGVDFILVEKASAVRSAGYMIDFFGSGYDAAERLGLLPSIAQIHRPVSRLAFLNREGREKFSVRYDAFRRLLNGRHFNFLRGDLERMLHAKLPSSADIRFGTTVDSIEQDADSVHAVLSDGLRIQSDVLVGADGLHSGVRTLVFGEETRFSRFLQCNAAAFVVKDPLSSIRLSDALYTLTTPGRQVAVYPVNQALATFFAYRSTKPPADNSRAAACDELARAYRGIPWIIPESAAR
jgi:2-polyprenyl-6-methoxyphenol hydroxylase-like FAD-dependent oxidoreductase